MNRLNLLLVVIVLCCRADPLYGQTNDWGAVQSLVPGTPISVAKHRGRYECELVKVTGSQLTCVREHGHFSRTQAFDRNEVREVRLEELDDNHTFLGGAIGIAVGTLAGLVVGAHSNDPETRVAAPVLFGLAGGAFGAGIGHAVHRHGAVIYRK